MKKIKRIAFISFYEPTWHNGFRRKLVPHIEVHKKKTRFDGSGQFTTRFSLHIVFRWLRIFWDVVSVCIEELYVDKKGGEI